MRPDPDAIEAARPGDREVAMLAADVRRLQAVIASGEPALTDAEREDLAMWRAECLRQCSAATDGGNEELAERWQGRANRAAAMLERLK